jgi:hypothetical protein
MFLLLFWSASADRQVTGGGRAGRQEEYQKTWYKIQLDKQWDGIKAHRAAVELGRQGGLEGGKARAASMTPRQRSMAASAAAKARWK